MQIPQLISFTTLNSSDLILLATGVVVWVSLRAAMRANELRTSPALILSFHEITTGGGSRDGRIEIKNIGKGPAYDIELHPITLNEDPRGLFTYTFHLDDRVMESGESRKLSMWVATPGNGVEAPGMMRFIFRLIPSTLHPEPHKRIQAETPALFIINYKGIDGRRYHSIYRLYSVLPPVGDIVMQLLNHGKGKRGILNARWHHLTKMPIPHEGNIKKPERSMLEKFLIQLHLGWHKK